QEVCARLGRITGRGIAANLNHCYRKSLVYAVVALLCAANLFNLAADIAAMAAAAHLVMGGITLVYALAFGALSLALQIYVPYHKYVRYLRWLTWSLFAYVATAFVVHVPWITALRSAILPSLSFHSEYLMALVGVLGTTISPYLFFWQASEEVEEVRVNHHETTVMKNPAS